MFPYSWELNDWMSISIFPWSQTNVEYFPRDFFCKVLQWYYLYFWLSIFTYLRATSYPYTIHKFRVSCVNKTPLTILTGKNYRNQHFNTKICKIESWLQTLFHKSTFDLMLRLDYPNLKGLVSRPLHPLLILTTWRGRR